MISNISFQSITEPTTQMTFNTFHFAGIYVKNLIFDFSILKEVINVFKRLKTPSMKIYLKLLKLFMKMKLRNKKKERYSIMMTILSGIHP